MIYITLLPLWLLSLLLLPISLPVVGYYYPYFPIYASSPYLFALSSPFLLIAFPIHTSVTLLQVIAPIKLPCPLCPSSYNVTTPFIALSPQPYIILYNACHIVKHCRVFLSYRPLMASSPLYLFQRSTAIDS